MLDFFAKLFDTSDFPARWNCGRWSAGHDWLHVLSDLGVWSACLAIPLVIGYFVLRRRDIPFRIVFLLFGAFILACGTTHLMEAVIFWWPAYRLAGLIKLLTALASWATVIALVPVVPKALGMRSPRELEREIEERKRVDEDLRALHVRLEERVGERTAELEGAVAALKAEIEERKRVERQLWESREQLRLVTDNAPVLLVHCDTEQRYKFVNRAYAEINGLTPQQVVGRHISEVVGERVYERLRAQVDAVLAGEQVAFEIENPYKVGGRRLMHYTFLPQHSISGAVEGFLAVILDVTERRKSENLLRSITDTLPALIAYVDTEGRYRLNNRTYEQWFGHPRSEMAGRHMRDVLGESAWAVIGPKFEAALAGQTVHYEDRVPYKFGGIRWIDATYTPHIDHGGAVDGVVVLVNDTSDRKEAVEQLKVLNITLEKQVAERTAALRDQTRIMESVLKSIGEGVAVADENGRLTLFNPAAERILGIGRTDLPSEEWSDTYGLFLPDGTTPFPHEDLPLMRAVRGQTCDDVELCVRNPAIPTGAFITVTARPVVSDVGAIRGGVAVFRDITARKHAESQIRASLEEKVVLLKEIHHRVKNNLQVISSLLDLQSQHTQDAGSVEMFRESMNRVRSMALIHERLYRTHDLARVDFAAYLDNLADHLFQTYRVDAEAVRFDLRTTGDVRLPIDNAVPCGLLVNELVSNCLKHAFRGRGTGVVRIDMRPLDGGTVRLTVADDGVGLPEGIDSDHAETFGLQLVGMLADQLRGKVEIDRGGGTAFRITFPVSKADASGG